VPSVPTPAYLGALRGGADPDLVDYEVELVDPVTGQMIAQAVPAADVEAELADFETAVRTATANLDGAIPPGRLPATSAHVLAVVELAAIVHGEWVRIHPYAN